MLVDTQALIWFGMADPRLSFQAAEAIAEPGNHYSLVSIWESAIKSGLGKLDLMRGDRRISAKEFFQRLVEDVELTPIPITYSDVAGVELLPPHHNDPFDRLLVAQALERNLAVISADAIFERYGVRRVW
jgi:PIN domain nuclease of toxin-antitoxin system